MKHRESSTEIRLREEKLREAKYLSERGYYWSVKWKLYMPVDIRETQSRVRMGMEEDTPVRLSTILARCIRSEYK